MTCIWVGMDKDDRIRQKRSILSKREGNESRQDAGFSPSCTMTSSNGDIFRVTGHLCGEFTGPGEFPAQRPVTRSFDVFFHLCLNNRLSKQSWGWWFETLSLPLWRQCNGFCHDAGSSIQWCRYLLGDAPISSLDFMLTVGYTQDVFINLYIHGLCWRIENLSTEIYNVPFLGMTTDISTNTLRLSLPQRSRLLSNTPGRYPIARAHLCVSSSLGMLYMSRSLWWYQWEQ